MVQIKMRAKKVRVEFRNELTVVIMRVIGIYYLGIRINGFVKANSKIYHVLKIAFIQKVRFVFQISKKNSPHHYPDLEI